MKTLPTLAVLLALAATPAIAHITVMPVQSRPAVQETYTLNVPTEGASATVGVELLVPPGVELVSVVGPAEDHVVVREGGRATTVRWTVNIPPREARKLSFVARNPASGERIQWNVHQLFADGTRASWIEGSGTRRPAPATRLSAEP